MLGIQHIALLFTVGTSCASLGLVIKVMTAFSVETPPPQRRFFNRAGNAFLWFAVLLWGIIVLDLVSISYSSAKGYLF